MTHLRRTVLRHDALAKAAVVLGRGVCVLFLLCSPVMAAKWADIPRELMLLQTNPYDKGAGALIVFNNGNLQVFYGDNVWWELKVYRRIKVFNDQGKRYATVSVPYGSEEKISDIEARAILPNGKIIPLDKMQVFVVPRISELGRYASLAYGKAVRFTVPGVENGAIIEYKYTKTSEDIYFLDPWVFQGEDYTLSSTFAATVPKEFQYAGHFVNVTKEPLSAIQRWVDGRGTTYTWTLESLPGIKKEPFMPPEESLFGNMQFVFTYFNSPSSGLIRILSDWEWVAARYGEWYRPYMGRRGKIPSAVQELTAGVTSAPEKIARIFDYVQHHIQHVPLEGVGFTGNYAGSIFEGKQAENVDMNVLLMAMLDEAKIPSYLAMLAPMDGPPFNQSVPSPAQFKRLVTYVPLSDGQTVWLDPVIRGTPYGIVPWQDQGVTALVLKGSGSFMTTPTTAAMSRETRTVKLTLSADGHINGHGNISATGQNAIVYRKRYAYVNDDEQRKTFLAWIRRHTPSAELDSSVSKAFVFRDQINGVNPVQVDFSFRGTDYATAAGKRLLVNPALLERIDQNILPAGPRANPIQLGPVQEVTDKITIAVPEGYTVEQLPAPVTVQSAFGRFLATYQTTPEGIVYTRSYSITEPNASARYYDDLRAFFDSISQADQQQIVLMAR